MVWVNPAIMAVITIDCRVNGGKEEDLPLLEFRHLLRGQRVGIKVRVDNFLTAEVFTELIDSTGVDEPRWSVNDNAHGFLST